MNKFVGYLLVGPERDKDILRGTFIAEDSGVNWGQCRQIKENTYVTKTMLRLQSIWNISNYAFDDIKAKNIGKILKNPF